MPRSPLPLALLLVALLAAPASARPADVLPSDALGADADALFARTNAYRAVRGAPPLVRSARLDAEARWFALDMALHDEADEDHEDSLGRKLWPRLQAFGVLDRRAAQNWAVGTGDPETAFTALRLSPDHDLNMRYRPYRTTGLAVAENPGTARRFYWVQTFSVYDDDAPPRLRVRRVHPGARHPAVVVQALAPGRFPRLEVKVRRGDGWGPAVLRPARLRLRAGEQVRVRAVMSGPWPLRGRWTRLGSAAD